jgi:protein-S-isoprenylcysteine O-methyltransferase Ste14
MHKLTVWQWNLCGWYVWMIVWGIAALRRKPDKAVEPLANRLAYALLLVCGFALLFSRSLSLGPLRARFAPQTEWLQLLGLALMYVGVALAIWARITIADNWSGRITVKVGHQLVTSGPYAFVRHPIYTGLLVCAIGTALQVGQWRCLAAIPIVALGCTIKAKKEERYMNTEFGERYTQYRQRTGFLVPRFLSSSQVDSASQHSSQAGA